MPFLLLFLDFIFNSYQFPLRHFIFTTIAAGIYIVINQIHACSVRPVYDIYECGNVWIPLVAFIILAATHMMGHLVWKHLRGVKITEVNWVSVTKKISKIQQLLKIQKNVF